MPKPRTPRSPRAEVLYRLRLLERFCVSEHETTEQPYFHALAELLAVLGAALENTRDPALWLLLVAVVSRRRAEALLLRRARAWPP